MEERIRHMYTDADGCRCAVDIVSEDGVVVFDSTPHLSFDFKKHGIGIKRDKDCDCDYVLTYTLSDGRLTFCGFDAHLSLLCKKKTLMGARAQTYNRGRWSVFRFDGGVAEYSGTLFVGKEFDFRFWSGDEKASPTPFCPEVYKYNGYIRLENGAVAEKVLDHKKETYNGR